LASKIFRSATPENKGVRNLLPSEKVSDTFVFPLHDHHVLDRLAWHQPDGPVHVVGAEAVVNDGPAIVSFPRLGFEVNPDPPSPPAVPRPTP
jgi:hypothetical protein